VDVHDLHKIHQSWNAPSDAHLLLDWLPRLGCEIDIEAQYSKQSCAWETHSSSLALHFIGKINDHSFLATLDSKCMAYSQVILFYQQTYMTYDDIS
jgi:hypothetical protein